MKTCLDCIPCMVRQALDASRRITNDPAVHEQVVRKSMRLIAGMDIACSPPELAVDLYGLINETTGVADPYEKIKERYNALLLSRYDKLKQRIESSNDRFETAIRIAIAGNIIDFGAHEAVLKESVEQSIDNALAQPINQDLLAELRETVESAKKILYLGDNAGEIVCDRLFIEELPRERVTFSVRGRPIINDVTMRDAKQVGMDRVVRVISTGTGTPGVDLVRCSEEFREAYDSADVIISKGQGNYETLNLETTNIFFLLKVKCGLVASQLDLPMGTAVIARGLGSS